MTEPWWKTESYYLDHGIPAQFDQYAGPNGVAVVRAWPDGTTDPGWGLTNGKNSLGFMPKYMRGAFKQLAVLRGYEIQRWNFAFVMRSMKLICIDIDGKNGGTEQKNIGLLGPLPPTLAETSKSGTGYHLFYATNDDSWHDERGFAQFSDRIGIHPGIDIRATGCVFHHPQQRWNNAAIAELPAFVQNQLVKHDLDIQAQVTAIQKLLGGTDKTELILLQDKLMDDLKKPIPAGRRNQTLYAIGGQLMLAQTPDWEKLIMARAKDVGLDAPEIVKLVANIKKYGGKP